MTHHPPKPHRFESFLKLSLVIIAIFSIAIFAAIFLVDSHSPTYRKIHDLTVVLLGVGALFLAVIASLDARAQLHQAKIIQSEMRQAIKELHKIEQENDQILGAVEKEEQLTKSLAKEVKKALKSDH